MTTIFIKKADMDALSEEEAIAIYGRPVYEKYKRHRVEADPRATGICVVTDVDTERGTITIGPGPSRSDG